MSGSTTNASLDDPGADHRPEAQRHIHWPNSMPLPSEVGAHHLKKLKSPPPPKPSEENSKVHHVLHPVAELEAKGREIVHSKHMHSGSSYGIVGKTDGS